MTEKQSNQNNDESNLEAALDRLYATARLHKHQPNLPGLSPQEGGQSPDPKALLTGRPLEIARDNPNPADTAATKLLLDLYHRPDGWHCPRCQQVFTNPEIFAQHLVDEFHSALQDYITTITQPPPKKKPTP